MLNSGGRINTTVSYKHTPPKVGFTTCKYFKSENLKKEKDSESACSEDSASLYEIKIKGLHAKL
jgi:hypothetical protein